jgi:large subunit ribosomal protein L13e
MAKISRHEALGQGICVDSRRRNKCNESLQLNVQRLKAYKARLVVFPTKKGSEWTSDMKSATQLETRDVLPIGIKETALEIRKITADEKAFSPYDKMRIERANKRQVGNRFKAARQAELDAAKEKK